MIRTRATSEKNHYPIVRIAFLSLFIASFFSTVVQGQAAQSLPSIRVSPDTINFGRVRVGQKRDSVFLIKDSIAKLNLIDLDFWRSLKGTAFYANTIDSPYTTLILDPVQHPVIQDSVFFTPRQPGLQIGLIPIIWNNLIDTPNIYSPTVVLIGTGIAPNVVSNGYNFNSLRVDSSSLPQTIAIINRGSDSTAIDSVTIMDSSEIKDSDFTIVLDTLPPDSGRTLLRLDYEGSTGNDTLLSFSVQFHPKSLSTDTLVIRIHTVDGQVIFDTFSGIGVEPLVTVNPKTINFDTVFIQKGNTLPADTTITFQIINSGTFAAEIDTIYNSDTNFIVALNPPTDSFHENISIGDTLNCTVTFKPYDEGNFADTIYVISNTRYGLYHPLQDTVHRIILKAELRTGAIGGDSISLGTITTCDPVTGSILLKNIYPVRINIDSIKFIDDTGGFSIPNTFKYPIAIAGDSTYKLTISYSFPYDSLNGEQVVKFVLFQRSGEGERPVLDTEKAYVERKERVFALHALLPTFVASADDIAPLRLPITVTGFREGVTELDNWTLSLQFSNDLFEPIGVDTTGSLAVPGDSTYLLTTHWDQASRTYTIIVKGSAVSDSDKVKDDLLLALKLQAFLTTDTVVTVTPTFTWAEHPCAYNLQAFTLDVPYANDCGDVTIRDAMLGSGQSINIISVWPNPADPAGNVSVVYDAKEPLAVTCIVFNEVGEEAGRFDENLFVGNGTLTIPSGMLPKSGPAFVRIETLQPSSAPVQSFKIEVIK